MVWGIFQVKVNTNTYQKLIRVEGTEPGGLSDIQPTAQTQPLRSWTASLASKGQREYWKIPTSMKNEEQSFFQKDVQSENPKFCFPPEGFGIPHYNSTADTGALGNAVLEVLSSLASAGAWHINDKRRKRREGNT